MNDRPNEEIPQFLDTSEPNVKPFLSFTNNL